MKHLEDQTDGQSYSRRKFLAGVGGTLALGGLIPGLAGGWAASASAAEAAVATTKPMPVCLMSKFLQFLNVADMAAVTAEMGYDGVDLCVRSGGHVLPERVADDLPKAVEEIRKHGLSVPMITAGIVDTASPHAEAILRTASALGIRRYRWGWFNYNLQRSLADQLAEIKPRIKALEEMNLHYKICAMYHTHSGLGNYGASIWDLWYLLKDLDSSAVGVNYDIGHATVEGGGGGWMHSLRLLLGNPGQSHGGLIKGIAVKDFRWEKGTDGKWASQWCPLGQGMVQVSKFLGIMKQSGFAGPLQMHFEYPLGGLENGAQQLTIPKQTAYAAMKRDLGVLRGLLATA
ncbi:MAG: sugar phosphate isomerase/epimerase [Verrucomicrobia bacterium]|nr:sugar phosphate isomerase/epimerase [Verrucomicrobiota bacterium]